MRRAFLLNIDWTFFLVASSSLALCCFHPSVFSYSPSIYAQALPFTSFANMSTIFLSFSLFFLCSGYILHFSLSHCKLIKVDGRQVNEGDPQKRTALTYAALSSQLDAISCLLDCGANINAADLQGLTALHWAASQEKHKVRRLEEAHRVKPN